MDAILNLWKDKRVRNWSVTLVAAIVVAMLIIGFSSANAGSTTAPTEASVVALQVGETIEASGSLEAQPFASLNWKTSGVVESVTVKAGDFVKAGEILVGLQPSSASASIVSAQADLVNAQKKLEDLLTSGTDLAQATIDLKDAQEEYKSKPLAAVIYAARQVTNGKLDTRISSEGPQDMRSLSDSFNEMASSLERNDRERREMFADIAHELRTPLSVIRGRLEGIVDGIYSADGSQVSLALEQTYLLERLVDDLRLLTLAEMRQLHFEKKSVDLAQLSRHTIDMFSAEAQEKNISLSLEKGRGNYNVQLDPQRMEQVVGNLIGNSLRYIPDGSKIWLSLEETSDTVKLSINDNGPGVAEEELPFLFDRFWRKDKSRARSAGGTGLGLAIAKQLIEAQGGTIHASNLSESGLQVIITFTKK